jgi:hypothetical protein
MVANVSSSSAVALDVSEIRSSNDFLVGNELVQKRIVRAHVGRGDRWRRVLSGAWLKDGVPRQDPNHSKSNREPGRVFHGIPRTRGATRGTGPGCDPAGFGGPWTRPLEPPRVLGVVPTV